MSTFQYKKQAAFQGANQSALVTPISAEELAAQLRKLSPTALLDDDPLEFDAEEQKNFEDKVAEILHLLKHVNAKKIYKYQSRLNKRKEKGKDVSNNKRLKILKAYKILQGMSYKEQTDFVRNYSDAYYLLMDSLFLEDLQKVGAGLVTGVPLESIIIGSDGSESVGESPLIQLLENPYYFNNEPGLIEMVLLLCKQVQILSGDTEEVIGKKKAFQLKVVQVLQSEDLPYTQILDENAISYGYSQDEDGELIPIESTISDENYKGFVGQMLQMLNTAKAKGATNNTGKVSAAFRFGMKGGGKGKYLELNKLSMSEFQDNKSYNGRMFGLVFADGGSVNIKGDLDGNKGDEFEEQNNPEGVGNMAYMHATGEYIPFKGMDYLADNMSMHFRMGDLSNLDFIMTWEAFNKPAFEKDESNESKKIKAKNRRVKATINLNYADLCLNNLVYRSRFVDEKEKNTKKQLKEFAVAIGQVDVLGLSMKNFTIEGTQHEFRNFTEVIYRITEGIQNSLYLIIDAVLVRVSQMVGKNVSNKDFEGFNKSAIRQILGGNIMEVSLNEGYLRNYVDTDKQIHAKIPLHGLSLTLGTSALNAEDAALWDLQLQLKAAQKELAELYEEKATFLKRHPNDYISRKKYDDKFNEHSDSSEIHIKTKAVKKIKLLIQGKTKEQLTNSPQNLSISSSEALPFEGMYSVQGMIREQIAAELKHAGMEQLTGLEAIDGFTAFNLLPKTTGDGTESFSLTGSIGYNTVGTTNLSVPLMQIPKLNAQQLDYYSDGFGMTGNNVVLTNLLAQINARWEPIKGSEKGEKPVFVIEDMALIDGTMQVDNFELCDPMGIKPTVRLSGKATLMGVSMKFSSLDKGDNTNFEDFEFGCTQIHIEDVAEFQMQLKENPAIENWLVENDNNSVVLSGFSFKNSKESGLMANDHETNKFVKTKSMSFNTTGVNLNNIGVDGLDLNTAFNYFNVTIVNRAFFDKEENATDTQTEIITDFEIKQIKLDELNKRVGGITIKQFKNPNNAASKLKHLESELVSQNEVLKTIQDKETTHIIMFGNGYLVEQKKADLERQKEKIAKTEDLIRRAKNYVGGNHGTFLNNVGGQIVTTFTKGKDDDNKITSVKVNSLVAKEVQTQNIEITVNATGKKMLFTGFNTLDNLGVSNVSLDWNKKAADWKDRFTINFKEGGTVYGSAISAPMVTTDMFELFGAGASSWYFTKLKDDKGFRYGINDLTGDYALDLDNGSFVEGDLDLSLGGGFTHDKENQLIHVTMSSEDLLVLPDMKIGDFELLRAGGEAALHGIFISATIKYKRTGSKDNPGRALKWVKFHTVNFDRVYMQGAQLKIPDVAEVAVDANNRIWLENVSISGLKYDLENKMLDEFVGTVTSDKFETSGASKIDVLNKDGGVLLNLLKGGINGESIFFEKASNGKIDLNVQSPEFLLGLLSFQNETGTDSIFEIESKNDLGKITTASLFKAGEFSYSNQKEDDDKNVTEGQFITVKNGVFNRLPLTGGFELKEKWNNIETLILTGKIGNELTIHIVDNVATVKAEGSTLNVEEMEIDIYDFEHLMEKETAPVDFNNDGEYNAFEKAFTETYSDNIDAYRKSVEMNDKIEKYRVESEQRVRESLGFTEDYVYECGIIYRDYFRWYLRLENMDKELQMFDDYVAYTKALLKETSGNITDDYKFLDHLTSGDVSISLFGESAELDLARIDTDTNTIKQGLWGSSSSAGGDNYATFANIEQLIVDITEIMGRNIDRTSFLSNAIGPGELYTDELSEDGIRTEALYTDVVQSLMAVTLIRQRNSENMKVVDDVRWLRLSSLLDTILFNPHDDALYGGVEQEPSSWMSIRVLTWDVKRRIKNYALDLLHHEMEPELNFSNVEFNLKGKEKKEKGILDFITSKEENLQFDLSVSLNQERRWRSPNKDWDHRNFKELGPQIKLTNFKLPKFNFVTGPYNISGDGITIASLEFLKQQLDTPNYHNGGAIPKKDDSAKIKGKNVKIKDFNLKIPLAKK